MRPDQIALQLWTVRRPLAEDLDGTLRAVAAAGYRAVELAGLPPVEPTRLASVLADAGLAVVASHEGFDRLRASTTEVADRLAELGCPRVVVPWLPEAERSTLEGARRLAAELTALGADLAGRGLGVAYHNHWFEFDPLDGTTLWDVLLAELPPDVEVELDVHWAAHGGRDPVAEIVALGDRVRLLHMKDRIAGPPPSDAPPGDGELPMADIVDAGRAAGVEWYIVEQDEPRDPLVDIRRGYENLLRLAR